MSAVEVTKKKKGKGNDGINNRLQIVMRSGKYSPVSYTHLTLPTILRV